MLPCSSFWRFALSHTQIWLQSPKTRHRRRSSSVIMDLDDPLDFENEDPLLTNHVVINKKRYRFFISSFTFFPLQKSIKNFVFLPSIIIIISYENFVFYFITDQKIFWAVRVIASCCVTVATAVLWFVRVLF